jgi:putative ABC transport system permease protein
MLPGVLTDPIILGLAQAGFALVVALLAVFLARFLSVSLRRRTVVALARGVVQVVVAGWILVLVFKGPSWVAAPVLLGMVVAAAAIARRLARSVRGAFVLCLISIAAGAIPVIGAMVVVGAINTSLTSLIPVGSMIVANCMNAASLSAERLTSDIEANTGLIETGLSLGAQPEQTVRRYVRAAVKAALIPHLNALSSLGIVWIPGLMAGMLIAGSDPVYAALYQFAVIAMIYGAGCLTALTATLLVRERAFSKTGQLLMGA